MSRVAAPARISDFFLRLADEPALLAEHEHNPRRAMTGAGLTPGQIDTVLDGDVELVRQAVETEVAADPLRRHLVVVPRMTTLTPKPEPEPEPEPEPPHPQRTRPSGLAHT